MSDSASAIAAKAAPWADDARVVGLVALAHGVSHFFHLILAPLYPWLREAYGYTYTELGFIMTVFFVASGGFQAVAGFIVDRWGALPTLVGGLFCLTGSAVVLGISDSYATLLVGAALGGLGNAVFHPVDFWFINHRISVPRLGPAYSAHGLSGSLGWALAPVFLVGIATPFGWRVAVLSAAILPVIVIALFLVYRAALGPREHLHGEPQQSDHTVRVSKFGFLADPAVWWCFAFFVVLSTALGGVQSFSPTIFMTSYGLAVTTAALSITVYMVASAFGMVAGAWLVMRRQRLEQNITFALSLSVFAAVLVGFEIVPGIYAFTLMAVMGFGSGLSGPSRDMMIRAVTPVGATGRVYGVVYSGLDVGLAIGPFAFGRMLDHGFYAEVFFAVAACLFAAMLTAWGIAGESKRRPNSC